MKHLQRFLLFSCLFISFSIQAQQNHFIYIQADNKQPFYVKVDKKIFSSSVSGYLILSKLKTGVYDLLVGFPQNEWPEQSIHCKIADTDLGYLLKNFGDNGWGLFNLQSLNIVMSANKKINKKVDTVADVKGDAFSNMLSEVVNDPTIKQKEPVKEEVKNAVAEQAKIATVTVKPVSEKITVAVKTDSLKEESNQKEALSKTATVMGVELLKDKIAEPVKTEGKNAAEGQELVSQSAISVSGTAKEKAAEFSIDNSKKAKTEQRNVASATTVSENDKQAEQSIQAIKVTAPADNIHTIIKKMSSKTSLGIEGIYIDSADGQKDTISVFIAAEKRNSDTMVAKKVPEEKVAEAVKPVVVKEESVVKEEKKQTEKFIDITVPATTEPAKDNKVDSALQQSTGKVSVINSDCKAQASEEDFLKLRKKMAGANNEEMMINIAKKAFKSRCFLTEQVKNLATLFLKDEKRYGFFDAAYPFVSDAQNFYILQSQLTDGYYINRFKVMIRH